MLKSIIKWFRALHGITKFFLVMACGAFIANLIEPGQLPRGTTAIWLILALLNQLHAAAEYWKKRALNAENSKKYDPCAFTNERHDIND